MFDLDFVVITMKARSGRKLYLKASSKEVKGDPYKVLCEWSLTSDDAIYFETDAEATKFANSYFKNFKGWVLEDVKAKI